MESGSTSPIRSTRRGTHSFIRKGSKAGWSSSMPNRRAAWRSIPGSSSNSMSCAGTRFAWRAATLPRIPTATHEERNMNEQLAVWTTLFLLGAYHGINPGMGWLFAVARGMQEHRTRAVAWSLPPIALGHALSIGVVVLVASLAQTALPLN